MGFQTELEQKLKEWGAAFSGCSNVGNKLPEGLRELKYAITVGVKLSDYIIDEISDKPTFTYFHHYRTVNALIDQITLRAMMELENQGYRALAVPASQTVNDTETPYSAIFPHKTAAIAAGLGWIGRNGLFISKAFGPRVRLGTVLTEMPLECTADTALQGCGACRRCVESCPAMALTGNTWYSGAPREHVVDPKACSDYMNKNFKHIGRGSVCGICIKVCPCGKKK